MNHLAFCAPHETAACERRLSRGTKTAKPHFYRLWCSSVIKENDDIKNKFKLYILNTQKTAKNRHFLENAFKHKMQRLYPLHFVIFFGFRSTGFFEQISGSAAQGFAAAAVEGSL
jgi:hypothetical protein